MYCLKCKMDHAADTPLCPVCDSPLVPAPLEAIEADDSLAVLFTTPDPALLLVVKSVLESARIPHLVQGEEGLHTFPLSSGGFFNASAYDAVIFVRRRDLPDARRLLQESATAAESDPP